LSEDERLALTKAVGSEDRGRQMERFFLTEAEGDTVLLEVPDLVERLLSAQSPAFDLADPEPIPEYEFDQSPPQDWDP